MKQSDWSRIENRHNEEFNKCGAVPKSLFWGKGKQKLRFFQLTRDVEIQLGSKVLDLGCGFADLYSYITTVLDKEIQYTGVDMSEQFCQVAQNRYKSGNVKILHSNFMDIKLNDVDNYDFIFVSGAFNYRLNDIDNYAYVNKIFANFLPHTSVLAIDFLSDKVDYQMEEYYYYNPSKILEMCYKYSRNVLLRNDCMPFEFSIMLRRDDTFSQERTTFNTFLQEKENLFEEGDFSGEQERSWIHENV